MRFPYGFYDVSLWLAVTSRYGEFSGKDIEIDRLHVKLVEAEEAGLIEKRITSKNDEP